MEDAGYARCDAANTSRVLQAQTEGAAGIVAELTGLSIGRAGANGSTVECYSTVQSSLTSPSTVAEP